MQYRETKKWKIQARVKDMRNGVYKSNIPNHTSKKKKKNERMKLRQKLGKNFFITDERYQSSGTGSPENLNND